VSASTPAGSAERSAPHCTVIEAAWPEAPAGTVPVGDSFLLTVKVTCPAGCDLDDLPATITGPDGGKILARREAGETVRRVTLTAPKTVGEAVWRIELAPCDVGGIPHAPSTLPVKVITRPQAMSLAVWGIPSPVVTGETFPIKVGAKSAASCNLAARAIEVRDEGGAVMGRGTLGGEPWPETAGLYWTELQLPAPAKAGMFSWTVQFDAAGLILPHDNAASRFSIAIVDPPEHCLTVKVIERETAAPVADAKVRLGAYRSATGPSGLAEILLPKGVYDLTVWRAGYDAAPHAVTIDADATVEVMVTAVPEDNPDSAWRM
jgi:hypothetical protein